MIRPWSNARYWLAASIAAALCADMRAIAAEPTTAALQVQGEAVDADAPTAYRLPLIGICDPADEQSVVRTGALPSPSTIEAPDTAVKPQAEVETSAENSAARLAFPATSPGRTAQLLPAVQRGYNLAQRGAFLAARTEFIQVLRRVAQAKDATSGTSEYSAALAAGLRAMDEADDFVPRGAQLEGELNVRSTASSHRTPALREHEGEVLPHDAVALYHKFAQERLARAAIDEQAGSMALYGLGKVYARLAERRDDDVQCTRGAMTMYCAALDACPSNNLAANELGVLLCRTGHPAEAVDNFVRAIEIAPNATTYHNLAVAQQKLGLGPQSLANEQESQRLAAWERSSSAVSRRAGVKWVTPAEMARITQPAPLTPATTEPVTAAKPDAPRQPRLRY
jgi:tetratricopeptide (TPR) repeat protein